MSQAQENSGVESCFEELTAENVEQELKRLKLIEENYASDDETEDRVRLSVKGVDINLLRAGQEVEFETTLNDEDNYDWYDEIDKTKMHEALYEHKKKELVMIYDKDENNNDDEDDSQTPFEKILAKMKDVTEKQDGGVMKRVLVAGTMNDEPFDSTYLRSKLEEFRIGDGSVVAGLDVAVSTMRKYEKAQFIFKPSYFMGERGCPPRIPGGYPVLFEIELVSIIEVNDYEDYENTPEEKRKKLTLASMLKICNCLRELGNDNYRRTNFKEASKKYRKAIYLLENTRISSEEEETKWKSVMLKLYLNMSQTSLKQTKPKKAIFYCKLALDIDPKNVKALFRYGTSLRLLQDFERARSFLQKAYNLAPGNKDITSEIEKLNSSVEKWKILEKDLYKKMLNVDSSKTQGASNQVVIKNDEPNRLVKEKIDKILTNFANNNEMKMYKMPADMYTEDMLQFAINKANSLNLHIRHIKGENNILQIMKND